jgi:hypothetical protein
MLTPDERKQLASFQNEIAELIDSYLRRGIDPTWAQRAMLEEAEGIKARADELNKRI